MTHVTEARAMEIAKEAIHADDFLEAAVADAILLACAEERAHCCELVVRDLGIPCPEQPSGAAKWCSYCSRWVVGEEILVTSSHDYRHNTRSPDGCGLYLDEYPSMKTRAEFEFERRKG